MTGTAEEALEAVVRSVPGVHDVYPASALPGAPRVGLRHERDVARAELKLAAGREVPALELVDAVAAALRSASGDGEALAIAVEISSID